MDTQFEKERDEILDAFIKGVKATIRAMEKLSLYISGSKDQAMVSALSKLESEIKSIIFSFNAKETAFCCNLVQLYKKYNKPHPLELEDVIANKEQELKTAINDAKKEAEALYHKLEQESVDPLILLEFFDWHQTLNFENLKLEYKQLAKNPEKVKETESHLRQQVLAALRRVIGKE